MDDSIAILGRQPALGLAELESLYGAQNIRAVGDSAAQVHVMPCSIDFSRLGGTIKLCKMLSVQDTTNWKAIEKFLVSVAPMQAAKMAEGKMHLGLSVYGLPVSTGQLLATGLNIKKTIQHSGRSVRLVPNKEPDLNAAQVIHNKLTGDNGWELVFVRDGDKTIIAQTLFVQDIESYGERDYGRPKRDARVGMLPPKLAQIIINLATGPAEFTAIKAELSGDICFKPEDDKKMHDSRSHLTVLDPFCGTGVILQEALLMGYQAYGTDLEPRMIDYTRTNLDWLAARYHLEPITYNLSVGDATSFQWEDQINTVACETYLGRPFTTLPPSDVLAQTMSDTGLIIKKFLKNIHQQLTAGTRLCLAIPAWQVRPGEFKHLPLVDQVEELGYNLVRFERVRNEDLLYYRADQIVARQLLVLTRI